MAAAPFGAFMGGSLAGPALRDAWFGPQSAGADARGVDQEAEGFRLSESEGILFALAHAVEQRDHRTSGHCERLAFMSVALGMATGLDTRALLSLYRAGYLHDVGKAGIPDSILFKPASLTPEEWDVMRTHPERGETICRPLASLAPVLPLIRHHHERWDGSGYPDGLAGEEIPLGARLLQVADIYDALTTQRSYKPAYSPRFALRIIREETARGWHDPNVVDLFLRLHESVLIKIAEFTGGADRSLQALRAALDTVQSYLRLDRCAKWGVL